MEKTAYIKAWSRNYSVQYCEMAIRCYSSEEKKHLPEVVNDSFYIPDQGNESFYVNSNEWARLRKSLTNILHSPPAISLLIKKFHFYGKKYESFAKKAGMRKLSNLSNQEIAKIHKNYTKIGNSYCAYLAQFLILSDLASAEASSVLTSKSVTDPAIRDALFQPSQKVGILKLQEKLQKIKTHQKTLNNKQIKAFLADFQWISCLDLQNEPWSKRDLIHYYKHLSITSAPQNFTKAGKMAKLNKAEIKFFVLLRELAYLRDMRDVYRRKGVYFILPLFQEIGRRLKLTAKETAFLTNREIQSGLSGGKNTLTKKTIQQRTKGFGMTLEKGEVKAFYDSGSLKKLKSRLNQKISISKNIFGVSASIGTATGTVKIILGVKDLPKIRHGDILVAISTHPDFVPAMQKAKAIITNEGGLTSHAAIVARELKIPCVVGTKVATKILKDGDRVEVDANNGIIKKL